MNYIHISILCLLLFASIIAKSQFYNHWIIGDSIYVEFTSGIPQFQGTVPFNSDDACATIADSSGNLLFYTNSKRIWNRNFELMLNADSINFQPESIYGSSITQGAMILPSLSNSNHYYVLCMDAKHKQLEYSLVDMTLDGGLGGVVDSLKCITLYEGVNREQLQAIRHGNGRDWWIICRAGASDTDTIMTLLLSTSGFSLPEFQAIGDEQRTQGEFVINSDGSVLVHVSKNMVQLFDFDRCSGIFSNPRRVPIAEAEGHYVGGAFSPSDEVLYVSSFSGSALYQIDLNNLEDSSSVQEIFRFGSGWNEAGHLELGPDGLIYMAFSRISTSMGLADLPQHLGVARNPDALGMACQFDTFGVWLGGRENRYSLPNLVNLELDALVGSACDSLTIDTAVNVIDIPIQNQIEVIPTISEGSFHIISNSPIKPQNISVVDLSGREVEYSYLNNKLFLIDPADGLYIVSIIQGNYQKSFKLIKQ